MVPPSSRSRPTASQRRRIGVREERASPKHPHSTGKPRIIAEVKAIKKIPHAANPQNAANARLPTSEQTAADDDLERRQPESQQVVVPCGQQLEDGDAVSESLRRLDFDPPGVDKHQPGNHAQRPDQHRRSDTHGP